MRAADAYEVVVVPSSRARRWGTTAASLATGALSAGTWSFAPDIERAEIRCRRTGETLATVTNLGDDLHVDRVRQVADDVTRLDADAFARAWLDA